MRLTVPTSSGVPARLAEQPSIMRRYPAPRGPANSSFAKRSDDYAEVILFTRVPRCPNSPPNMTRSELPRFES